MSPDEGPTLTEKQEALRTVLASATFSKLPVLSPLLQRLVNDTLLGIVGGKGYETTLAVEVLRKDSRTWTPLQNDVRQAMHNLRKHLRAYHSGEGHNDKVEIAFPKRAGYGARFSYRSVYDGAQVVERLADAFWRAFPDILKCDDIIQEIKECISKYPYCVPAHALLAETILACTMCDCPFAFGLPQALPRAEEAVITGMGLNREYWRLHVVAGAIHCCRFAWSKADTAFKTALHLAPDETATHFWYAAFLHAIGRTQKAMDCVNNQRGQERRRLTLFIRPLFFYVRQEFKTAYEEIIDNLPCYSDLDRIAHTPAEVDLTDIGEWPGDILMSCVCFALGYEDAAAKYASAGVLSSKMDTPSGALVPLFVAVDERRQKERAAAINRRIRTEQRSPVWLALAALGAGQPESAIEMLALACDFGHPLMVWLHLWPIFDSLREHEHFKALIKRMNLPSEPYHQQD